MDTAYEFLKNNDSCYWPYNMPFKDLAIIMDEYADLKIAEAQQLQQIVDRYMCMSIAKNFQINLHLKRKLDNLMDEWFSIDTPPKLKTYHNKDLNKTVREVSVEIIAFDGETVFPESYSDDIGFHPSIKLWRHYPKPPDC